MKEAGRGHDEVSTIERRISYLVGARLREADKIRMAIEKQDELRKAHLAPQGWDSVSAIRKWREA